MNEPIPTPPPNLDDVTACPLGHRCESCGREGASLAVETVRLSTLGVACLTLCRRCAAFDDVLPISVTTAVRLVGQHCAHLGIDLDEMVAAIDGAR